mmetsp:Transcript_77551/g.224265  ORF Transcript_77551/g.224265 Transcript_77551/m.224265 type:complete len:279 (+) Transcript_77551:376-1212(+)
MGGGPGGGGRRLHGGVLRLEPHLYARHDRRQRDHRLRPGRPRRGAGRQQRGDPRAAMHPAAGFPGGGVPLDGSVLGWPFRGAPPRPRRAGDQPLEPGGHPRRSAGVGRSPQRRGPRLLEHLLRALGACGRRRPPRHRGAGTAAQVLPRRPRELRGQLRQGLCAPARGLGAPYPSGADGASCDGGYGVCPLRPTAADGGRGDLHLPQRHAALGAGPRRHLAHADATHGDARGVRADAGHAEPRVAAQPRQDLLRADLAGRFVPAGRLAAQPWQGRCRTR